MFRDLPGYDDWKTRTPEEDRPRRRKRLCYDEEGAPIFDEDHPASDPEEDEDDSDLDTPIVHDDSYSTEDEK